MIRLVDLLRYPDDSHDPHTVLECYGAWHDGSYPPQLGAISTVEAASYSSRCSTTTVPTQFNLPIVIPPAMSFFKLKILTLCSMGAIFGGGLLLIPNRSAPSIQPAEAAPLAQLLLPRHAQTPSATTSTTTPTKPKRTALSPSQSSRHSVNEINRENRAKTPVPPQSAIPSAINSQSQLAQPALQVRVRVSRSTSQLTIAASSNAVIRDCNRHEIALIQSNQAYSVSSNAQGDLQIGATSLPDGLWVDPESGAVWVNGRWYEGQLQLVNTGSELVAINQIDIERYLYSVVGSEMYPAWNLQALKAQAIAARSYAAKFLENPANDQFNLGSDEAFQAYKGLESVTASTIQAVEETRGQVLVHDHHILLAQYAATDALTRSAHRGQGMSQEGAQIRAELGWSYLEILGDYYRNAALALLPNESAQSI